MIMLAVIMVILASLFLASLFGWVIHWAIHQRWSGFLRKGHMRHHEELYPLEDLVSDEYRRPEWYENGAFLFMPFFVLVFGLVAALALLSGAPMWSVWMFYAVTVLYGIASDLMHDSFHLRVFWMQRFAFYMRLRQEHFAHHVNMGRNYGILVLVWDRLMGTHRSS